MHIHILGICGTFMGGIALLARAAGHTVSGQDANVYPPMSTQLAEEGIALTEGYDSAGVPREADLVVIGNALSRGNGAVEHVLNQRIPYTSGAQWLGDNILRDRWVLAVAGTHGKTTTSAMLAWILEYAGMKPGFLIGGIPRNFSLSARAGESPFFVVEADEYDTSFFDKRSKFVHYRPQTLVLNNLEYDHADIFPDLAAIQRQFHHLVRTVPGTGLIVANHDEPALQEVLAMGAWTPIEPFALDSGDGWSAERVSPDGGRFDVCYRGEPQGTLEWQLCGAHNVMNALAAIAAARHAGVPVSHAIAALAGFENVKRRMEVRGVARGVTVYDDFAHHPTAIASTVAGLRKRIGSGRILAVLEPRSNTMRMGVHKGSLASSLHDADMSLLYRPPALEWDTGQLLSELGAKGRVFDKLEPMVQYAREWAEPGDHVLVMSNGGFGGIHQRLLEALAE